MTVNFTEEEKLDYSKQILNPVIKTVPLKSQRITHCLYQQCKKPLCQSEEVILVIVNISEPVNDSIYCIFCSKDCWDSYQHEWLIRVGFY